MDTFEFGPFRLDVAEHVLSETGRAIPLKPKVFETLVLLVRNSGHLMTKQDLMSALWPETVVDETNLTKNIWLIRRALGEREDSAAYIETVPRVGYRFVGAIRRVEADGPEPLRAAAPMSVAAEAPTPRPPPRSRVRTWTVLGAVLLLAIAGGLWLGSRTRRFPGLSTGPQRSIAVLGFRNLSGRTDLDWMATALREMLQAELSSSSSYHVLAAESAERIRRELALVSTASLSPESLGSVRRRAPVDEIVGGSYLLTDPGQGSQIRIDVVVQDAKTGETLHAMTETGDAARLLEVVSSVGSRLRLALRESALSAADSGRARATLPRKPATLLLYTRGLEEAAGLGGARRTGSSGPGGRRGAGVPAVARSARTRLRGPRIRREIPPGAPAGLRAFGQAPETGAARRRGRISHGDQGVGQGDRNLRRGLPIRAG